MLDRHGPTCSATSYLQRLAKANIFEVWDINHSSWNSEMQTVRGCSLMPWLLMMLVSVNLLEGPFSSSSRFQESIQRMNLVWSASSPTSMPAFMQALPEIVKELGLGDNLEDTAQIAWGRLRTDGPLRSRGYKCNLNRFYGFVTEGEKALNQFAQRGYIYLHVALQCDFLAGVGKIQFRLPAPDSGAASSSTSALGPGDRALRDVLANAYSIAAVMFNDISNRMKLAIVVVTGRHNKAWQGSSTKFLRGAGKTSVWLRRQITSEFFMTMENTIQEMSREASVEEIGFHVSSDADKMHTDEGEVKWQDSFVKLFFRYTSNLVANRLFAELWWLTGWTAHTVFFDEDTPAVRELILGTKRSYEDSVKFQEQAEARRAGFQAIVRRSPFETPHLQQIVAMLQASNWEMTSDIQEDGFQREEVAARQHQVHRQGREILGYHSLVQSNVLSMHKLTVSEPRNEEVGRSETLDDRWTKPQLKKVSMQLNGLGGYNSSPSWHSPQATRLHLAYVDIPMVRFVVANDAFDKLRHFWLGGMMHCSHMIIVRKKAVQGEPVDPEWLLPLKHCADAGVLVWPVLIRKIGNLDVVEPRIGERTTRWIFVSSLSDW